MLSFQFRQLLQPIAVENPGIKTRIQFTTISNVQQRSAPQRSAQQRSAQQRSAQQRSAQQRSAQQRSAQQRSAQQRSATCTILGVIITFEECGLPLPTLSRRLSENFPSPK
jgi:thiol:disulfide interchange protein